jgi:SNF2 family DNA or RNA helicase
MSSFRFEIGTRVRDKKTHNTGSVRDYKRLANTNYYIVDLAGDEVTISENQLEPARDILDRLADQKNIGNCASDFDLVMRATALSAALGQRGMSCLTNARLEAKAHQVFVAHRVLQDLYPRYILADEVGLGKTIEAGLVLKELKARGLAERVLIVTPASLCEQWRGELYTKFNERFVIYNGQRIRDNLARWPEQNPWGQDHCVITSLQFARGQCTTVHHNPGRRKDDPRNDRWIDEIEWDLVIFDEAHHLRRRLKNGSSTAEEFETTQSYRLAQALEGRARSILLLTATPLQTGQDDAYALIRLIDPYLFRNFSDFEDYLDRTARGEWHKIAAFNQALARPEREIRRDDLARHFNETLQACLHFRTYEDLWATLFARIGPTTPISAQSTVSLAQVQRCYDYAFLGNKSRPHQLPSPKDDPLFRAVQNDGRRIGRALVNRLTLEGLPELLIAHREVILDWISRQHKLSRVMIRNRKRVALKGELVEREAHLVPVQLTQPELDFYEEVSDYIRHSYSRLLTRANGKRNAIGFILTTFRKLLVSSRQALAASLDKRAARLEDALRRGRLQDHAFDEDEADELEDLIDSSEEREDLLNLTGSNSRADVQAEIALLRDFAQRARQIAVDRKAEALLDCVAKALSDDPDDKLLIFTQFRETQRYLQRLLQARGYKIALFHGEESGSSYSKRIEFERFKRDPQVQVMIATDVGGEGLNLQFCRNLINYDLPWNPMNIEQRIGRIDRIGQKRSVRIFNFALEDTIDGRILHVLQERVQIFEETVGMLDPIIGEQIESTIKNITFQSDKVAAERRLKELAERMPQRIREAHEASEKLADFVMDSQSFQVETVEQILGQEPLVRSSDIERLVRTVLGRFQQARRDPLIQAERPGVWRISVPGMLQQQAREHYTLNMEPEYIGTFDNAIGSDNEGIDFFAVGHPLVDAVLQFGTNPRHSGLNYECALRVLEDAELAGFEGVQFNYLIIAEGMRTYRRLVPIVLDRHGTYCEARSQRIFELHADERAARRVRHSLTLEDLQALQQTARSQINRIAERIIEENEQRHQSEVEELRDRQQRMYSYRLHHLHEELSRRQQQARDARNQHQEQRARLLEGQVAATTRRIKEIESRRDQDLAQIDERHQLQQRFKCMSVAVVRVLPPSK